MKHIKKSVSSILIVAMILSFVPKYNLKKNYKKLLSYNIYSNSSVLNEYDVFLNEYAKYINNLELSDLEIIIKVMTDIWYEVDGYGKPEETIVGLYNLSFIKEGVGVCTSFADEFTNRMNRINYRYNARNIILDSIEKKDIEAEVIDVERPIINSNDNNSQDDYKYSGHMVSAVDLIDEDITLIVDTTNIMLGILKNGKVYMFNCEDYLYDYDVDDNYSLTTLKLTNILSYYVSSYFNSKNDINEYTEQYGINNQKEVYDIIDDLPKYERKLSKILK